jgi:hypothetical protein
MPASFGQGVSTFNGIMVQRKSGCACGGGCPGCKGELDELNVQSKLAISTPDDPFEREADRVAEVVMRMPTPLGRSGCTIGAKNARPIQQVRDSSPGTHGSVANDFVASVGSGSPLDPATKAYFEPRLAADFGNVRVHAGGEAAASASTIGARAYTVGGSIVFGAGEYRPQTVEGRHLLAHELTHVMQQRGNAPGVARIQRACGPAAIGTPAGCTPVSGEAAGERFLFAVNCDSFLVPSEQARLELFADTIVAGETIAIHGYASRDGATAFNESLSCARALKAQSIIQSILIGKNVSATVRVFMHGANQGPNPADQRSVVVDRSGLAPPVPVPPPTPTPTPVPTPPAPTLSSCNPAQVAMVAAHTSDARKWIDNAVPRIHAFAAGTASAADATIVSASLTANFHTTAPADVATIASNFDDLRTSLASAFALECVSARWCSPNDLAYVRGAFAVIRRLGDVNLCPLWFGCGEYFTRVSTIIHEVAHQHPGAYNDIYEWAPAYTSLSPADAIDNADSYAVTGRQIYHMGAHGPGTPGPC